MSAALAVSGLVKRYGAIEALGGVDLEVGESELVGLLGPNGVRLISPPTRRAARAPG